MCSNQKDERNEWMKALNGRKSGDMLATVYEMNCQIWVNWVSCHIDIKLWIVYCEIINIFFSF